MKLKKLLKNISVDGIKGSRDVEITGICSHSKRVAPGNLFIAKKGKTVDGSQFILEAVSAGASVIVTDIYNPFINDVVQVIHHNPSDIEGQLSAQFHNHPSEELLMIGITGTNGKTTTAMLARYLLEHTFGPCGLIGTIEYSVGPYSYPATHTTPESPVNQKMLREMLNHHCRSAIMEVTSHALEQRRVDHIDFDIALFTNLSQDHLDYHGSMESYCQAKEKLFSALDSSKEKKHQLCPKTAIVNIDDPSNQYMLKSCNARVVTYGIDNEADIKATNIELNSSGTIFDLSYQNETVRCNTPFIGRYNIYNTLGAVAIALTSGAKLDNIGKQLLDAPHIPGRLEPVVNDLGLNIFVDFAHTPDALSKVLETLKETQEGRIFTIFGCGGDRDKGKRPKMATISERYSDLTIVTADNPRSEEPEAIAMEVIKGFHHPDNFSIELSRTDAIQKAIQLAKPKDIILIAGKGHENHQIFSHRTIKFDDKSVAEEACKLLRLEHSISI